MLSSTDNGGGLNSISFSAVWENLQADADLNEEIKNQFEAMIKAANNYTYYRYNPHSNYLSICKIRNN